MVKSVTPILGVDLASVHPATSMFAAPFLPGTRITADDAHDYIYVRSSADIAADTEVTLVEPAMTVSAGAGGLTSPSSAVLDGDSFWCRKNDI